MVIGLLTVLSFWIPFVWVWYLGHFFHGLCLGVITMVIIFFSLCKLHNTPQYVEGALNKGKVINLTDTIKGDKNEEKTTD